MGATGHPAAAIQRQPSSGSHPAAAIQRQPASGSHRRGSYLRSALLVRSDGVNAEWRTRAGRVLVRPASSCAPRRSGPCRSGPCRSGPCRSGPCRWDWSRCRARCSHSRTLCPWASQCPAPRDSWRVPPDVLSSPESGRRSHGRWPPQRARPSGLDPAGSTWGSTQTAAGSRGRSSPSRAPVEPQSIAVRRPRPGQEHACLQLA